MADRWMDERDREWRDRDWRRAESYGRGEDRRWGEDRSWSGASEEGREPYGEQVRQSMYDRDDDEDYGGRSNVSSGGGAYGAAGGYGGGESYRGGGRSQAYQSPRRPAAGAPRFGSQDYTGRSDYGSPSRPRYDEGDDARSYRQTYGRSESYGAQGGRDEESGRYAREDRDRADRSQEARRFGGYDRGDERREERRGEGGGDFLQRAGERISSWFRGDNLMHGSRDEGDERRSYREDFGREARPIDRGHRGIGPKGYQRSDERISDEVHERLTDDPWLDASDIEVEVKGGEVTLSGHVDNREAKHRAERLIEDLSGVRHVQNNLRVDPNASFTGAGRGFGSSALEAEMRRNAQGSDPGNNGVSGLSGRTSTGALAERSSGTATETSVDPKTGQKRS